MLSPGHPAGGPACDSSASAERRPTWPGIPRNAIFLIYSGGLPWQVLARQAGEAFAAEAAAGRSRAPGGGCRQLAGIRPPADGSLKAVSKPLLSPADWYASLPAVYASACLLLTDTQDRVLLVKPNYRSYWAIPGGMVEADETPHECAAREITEEIGLDIKTGDLLVIDWIPPEGDRPRVMTNYIFDGGTIDDPSAIRIQDQELDDIRFWTWEEAETKMPANTAARIPAARQARKNRRTIYLPGSS